MPQYKLALMMEFYIYEPDEVLSKDVRLNLTIRNNIDRDVRETIGEE